MERFFIITNKLKDAELQITHSIADFFDRHGKMCSYQYLEVLEEAKTGRTPLAVGAAASEDDSRGEYPAAPRLIDERTECILVIGGDGTLLKAARFALELDIPILGINCGTLGFLAEVEKDNLEEALTALLSDDLEIEERMMLSGSLLLAGDGSGEEDRKGQAPSVGIQAWVQYTESEGELHAPEAGRSYALNDIVLTRHGTLRILSFDLYVNGKYLSHYSADGVIVSTPTGSTGYSMSAGGPIIEPKAELLLITPICPHTLGTRSIILSAEDQVELRIPAGRGDAPQEVEVNFDGNHRGILRTGDAIRIGRADRVTKFVRFSKVSFLEALHKKMSE